jgi:hypothetical protein
VFELFHQIHGGHVIIPGERHALAALEDSVVLLTVVEPVPTAHPHAAVHPAGESRTPTREVPRARPAAVDGAASWVTATV